MSAFANRISQDVDIRFQLPWNFGDYLVQIPRHLGVSESLDAAVDALVSAHTWFCAGNLKPGSEVLAKHARSLAVLRHDLNDGVKARKSETLAAIMVMSITQLFVCPDQSGACTHTNGATRLLMSKGLAIPRDEFERQLLLTLPDSHKVFEALLTDNIQLSTRDWKLLNGGFPDAYHKYLDGQWFSCIADVPDLIQRSKAALILDEPPSLNFLGLELEVRAHLENIKPIITKTRDRLDSFDRTSVPAALGNHLQAHYLRSLAMALGVGIILNCLLSGLDGTSAAINEESVAWSDEIVQLAERCTMYRPLGSLSMSVALRMAWPGAGCEEVKERIQALLVEYGACVGLTEETDSGALDTMKRRWTLQQL
ncbi:MAG: hypothetical protein Q9226_006431 [Calogaya cf. arnoldii]